VADARQQIQAAAQEAASQAVSVERRLSSEQWEQKFAAGRAEIANETTRALEKFQQETEKRQLESINAQREATNTRGAEVQQQVASALASAQSSWQERVSKELEAAHAQLRERLESTLAEAQDRAAGGLNEHLRSLLAQLQEETARHTAVVRESAGAAGAEWEQRLTALRDAVQEQSQKQESILAHAGEAHQFLEQHSADLQNAQQTLAAFQTQLNEFLAQRRNELHRESQSLIEHVNARIRSTFEEYANQAMEQFNREIQDMVQPHIARTEEAIHRLAGGRSMVDAALALQQDRIRASADEAFAESLAQFRENLGSVEEVLRESSQSITGKSLAELEGKVGDLKHQVVDVLHKSAEWYAKKAQTQIQNHSEKAVEQTVSQLRDKAREVSGVFATELDHSSRNFLDHTQTQMEDVVRDSFERARALFAEAADTTAAAFIDEIQRTARQELGGYNEELKRSTAQERTELALEVSAEQEAFLKRFQESLGGALQTGVTEAQKTVFEGFTSLLQQWKTMTAAHQQELQRVYDNIGEQAAEHHKTRLEGVSNQWLLATVVSLDHQSREMISGIAAATEEKLRAACSQVFEGMGDSLRQRLSEIAKNFTPPAEPPPPRAKGASTGN